MATATRIGRSLALGIPLLALLAGVGDSALGQLNSPELGPERRQAATAARVHLRLLGVNDFHGHLESPGARRRGGDSAPKVPVGGAAVLGSHLDKAAREVPGRTIRVHAGDMVGASPLVSSHFHDEPAVEAMNLMRFDVGTLGNHEFDEGAPEMLRLLRGGRRSDGHEFKAEAGAEQVNTSKPGFEGMRFPYIAANAVDSQGRPMLPPTAIVERAGVRVGFIGVTTATTPEYLLPRHRTGLRFLDISDTVNSHVPRLRAQGVRAIVVLAHSGAREEAGSATARGEIMDEAAQMSDDVDVVIAGHTHSHLNLEVPNRGDDGTKLVVEALSFGVAYGQVDLSLDRRTGEVVSKSARTPMTWSDEVEPEADLKRLVSHYSRRLAPLARRVLGHSRRPLRRRAPTPGEPADGLAGLAAAAQRRLARADVAFVNPGNLRGDLDQGAITYEDLFGVAPYEHQVLRVRLRGRDILRVLEQQASPEPAVWLHVSGMTWERGPSGIGGVVMADGQPLRARRMYTVAANELLVGTGRFSVLAEGDRVREVGTDLEALVAYMRHTKGRID